MSAARPFSPLLSASLSGAAAVALTLAAPGTALADPGNGGKGADNAQGQTSSKGAGRPAKTQPAAEQKPATQQKAAEQKPAKAQGSQGKAPKSEAPKGKPAKPAKDSPTTGGPAVAGDAAPASAPADPPGNNGTIKIDTVPADADRANRPHPGCAFTVQFFGFDAGQTADITFTGQAPTRSAGPLLSLSGRTISTTPADGALEEGHSLVLSATDLGLLDTPTAAKGWHVKVTVDALEAPGGAKQKVFWLDCPAGADQPAAVEEDGEQTEEPADGETGDQAGDEAGDEAGDQAGDEAGLAPNGAVSPTAADRALRPTGEGVVVLSETATRSLTGEATTSEAASDDATLSAAAASDTGSSTSLLPSVLPFTGAAGVAAMLAAGLGAVAAGAVALRAGRRRTTG